ncbi:unnamed protein product, partial [Brachionus calyciflorus]
MKFKILTVLFLFIFDAFCVAKFDKAAMVYPYPNFQCLKLINNNYNLTQLIGKWYVQVGTDDIVKQGSKCKEMNIEQKNEFTLINNLTSSDEKSTLMELVYDPIKNVLKGVKQIPISPVLVLQVPIEFQVVYLNDKYQLIYGCGTYFVYSSINLVDSFYLLKKDRNFNNFDEMYNILSQLKLLKADLNNANFVLNNA